MNTRHCFYVCLIFFFSATIATAHDGDDKRPLEHSDYDLWNSVAGTSLSNDGKWVMYTVRPGKGDATLKIHNAISEKEYSIVRGSGARFSDDSQWAVYRINPDPELLKKLKKEKKPADQMPSTLLEILHLESGRHTTILRTSSFSMPAENSNWLAYQLLKPLDPPTVKQDKSTITEAYKITPEGLERASGTKPKLNLGETSQEQKKTAKKKPATKKAAAKPEKQKTESKAEQKPDAKKKKKTAGTTLVLRNMKTGVERSYPNVVSFIFSKNGKRLAYATSTEKEPKLDGVTIVNLEKRTEIQIASGLGNYRNLVFNIDGSQLAFVTDRDDYQAEKPSWSLFHYRGGKTATKIAAEGTKGIPENWWISSTAAPAFTEDGRRLLFSTAPKPDDVDEKKDADADEEPKAKLDLWHWQDPFLQPQQLLQAEQERRRSYRALYDLRSKKIIQLATKEMPTVAVDPRRKSDITLGVSDLKYRKQMSWESPRSQDVYTVNLSNGKSTLLVEAARSFPRLSPDGKFVTWWDPIKRQWFASPTAKPNPIEISSKTRVPLFNELHDTPSPAGAYGSAGWLAGDKAFLVYDKFDVWQLDPTGKSDPICLTNRLGRKNEIRFRIQQLDREARAIDPSQPIMLSAFEHKTKASGFYRLELSKELTEPKQLMMLDESVGRLQKAKHSEAVVFTRQTFVRSPDVWYSTTDLKHISRVSRANPQQHEYTWGTAELMHWKATDGKPLDGILYKPEGFDPTKKYPLMVYFYEKYSDNLHRYNAPAAGRSTINFSFYVSRGYCLFIPDIPYKTGYPGASAANSILPGVESIVAHGYIDKNRIGMQGHSWGGYQTAYLVTKTDMFACAESGAPVSNMTSAYGGIRWGSGMSRMFQYERTQSRIGKPLWQARDLYLENSPVFYADKINTPLLILHNDQDGAVPWYQGIELFVAMRRLSKPAWLMNYNGEPHWVMKPENRVDFAKRMQTFFDHYLKGDPMPEWMATGIPAVDKGKKFGFEPVKQPAEAKK